MSVNKRGEVHDAHLGVEWTTIPRLVSTVAVRSIIRKIQLFRIYPEDCSRISRKLNCSLRVADQV